MKTTSISILRYALIDNDERFLPSVHVQVIPRLAMEQAAIPMRIFS